MTPLVVNAVVTIPAADLSWRAVRSSGPGGQNVNKVASKVELRFDLPGTTALDAETKTRLRTLARARLDADGWIYVVSQRTRDQAMNLGDCRDKLRDLVLAALHRPRPRKATRPTRGSRERRLGEKRRRSSTKRSRRGEDD